VRVGMIVPVFVAMTVRVGMIVLIFMRMTRLIPIICH
jgi:hypothetical protein